MRLATPHRTPPRWYRGTVHRDTHRSPRSSFVKRARRGHRAHKQRAAHPRHSKENHWIKRCGLDLNFLFLPLFLSLPQDVQQCGVDYVGQVGSWTGLQCLGAFSVPGLFGGFECRVVTGSGMVKPGPLLSLEVIKGAPSVLCMLFLVRCRSVLVTFTWRVLDLIRFFPRFSLMSRITLTRFHLQRPLSVKRTKWKVELHGR